MNYVKNCCKHIFTLKLNLAPPTPRSPSALSRVQQSERRPHHNYGADDDDQQAILCWAICAGFMCFIMSRVTQEGAELEAMPATTK